MDVDLKLNPAFKDETFKENLKATFSKELPTDNDNFELIVEPFKCLVLKDVVDDAEKSLPLVEKAVMTCAFKERMNDLFTFQQTQDFKRSKKKIIRSIRTFFLTEILPWLKSCTNIPLEEDVIDIGCSRYKQSDVLLCHDDELEGRRVAFVWYLVPEDWADSDGGHLDLISSDSRYVPGQTQRSILPRRNSLVLFEVSPKSWHQVREILSSSKVRYSINGWFNGPAVPREARVPPSQPAYLTPTEIEEELLYGWVQKKYLTYSTQSAIHDNILEDSQILLTAFLHEEKYELLRAALRNNSIVWQRKGPPNSRCVDVVNGCDSDLPEPVRAMFRLLSSEAMMVVFADMTGLSLHSFARRMEAENDGEPESKRSRMSEGEDGDGDGDSTPATMGKVYGQLRRWSTGCYTMLTDSDVRSAALDATLFVDCESWNSDMGGYHSYIVKNEAEELLCVEPTANAVALVYRDEETLQFVKYLNLTSAQVNSAGAYYDFAFMFTERSDEK